MSTSGMHRRPFEGRHLVFLYETTLIKFVTIFQINYAIFI